MTKVATMMSIELKLIPEVFQLGIIAGADREYSDDGENDSHGSNEHWGDNRLELHGAVAAPDECGGSEGRGGEYRSAVRFVQVGSHTGDVSYIITYVVGDCCGVSRVVFGDSRFDFPDAVSYTHLTLPTMVRV